MTTKIEGNGMEAKTNTFSTTSTEIAKRLLQGWTMLNSICSICRQTPLLKEKNAPHHFCARCNVFMKTESNENVTTSSASTAEEETKKEEKEEKEQKQEQKQDKLKEDVKDGIDGEGNNIEKEMEEGYNGDEIYRNKIELSDYKENEPSDVDLYGRINSSTKCNNSHFFAGFKGLVENGNHNNVKNKEGVKYIREIKLQTAEFDEFMNNSTIPQMETTALVDLNTYINEKCGNCFTDYLKLDNSKERMEDDVEKGEDEEKGEPVKEEPVKVEPVKVEPIKVEPVKVEPIKVEPVKVEPIKVEPVKVEPVKEEPVKVEPVKDEGDKKERNKDERYKNEPDGVEIKVEPAHSELRIRRYSCSGNVICNCRRLEKEYFIFEKVRYALLVLLERYANELIDDHENERDDQLVTRMAHVTNLVEQISNLINSLKT